MKLLKSIALLVLTAGLLLQNLHALAMPLCNGQKTDVPHQHLQADPDGQHNHADHDDEAPAQNTACDGCSMCHACSAPAVASTPIAVSANIAQIAPEIPASHVSLFTPEQPRHPPRKS